MQFGEKYDKRGISVKMGGNSGILGLFGEKSLHCLPEFPGSPNYPGSPYFEATFYFIFSSVNVCELSAKFKFVCSWINYSLRSIRRIICQKSH